MAERILVFLALTFSYLLTVAARTSQNDITAMNILKSEWQNTPPNWAQSDDPCGSGWVGIDCNEGSIISITLPGLGLVGDLSSEISLLTELRILDLSYNKNLTGTLPKEIGNLKKLEYLSLINCSFYGPIPDTIGNLQWLKFLALNSNSFSGGIPPSIGTLLNIDWLDLADNRLQGQIPISNATSPGLDMLHETKHFHFGKNQLSGNIPPQLFGPNMSLLHVLFETNQFEGSIPSTLVQAQSLKVVRFDNNFLSGSVPSNINNLQNLNNLYLSHNRLTGPLPNLTGMNILNYLDLSNNSFDQSDFPPWLSTLQTLTTVMMEQTNLQGKIPVSFFSLDLLQTVVLRSNRLNGTLDIGTAISNQLELLDLQNNFIEKFNPQTDTSKVDIILVDNPVCGGGGGVVETYCSTAQPSVSYTPPPNNCAPVSCFPDQTLSPSCKCAYPYTGTFTSRAPSFWGLGNRSIYKDLEVSLMLFFQSFDLPVDTVNVSDPSRDATQYLNLRLRVFPSGSDSFNRTGTSIIALLFSNQIYSPPPMFGPCVFNPDNYGHYMGDIVLQSPSASSSKSSNIGIIVGAAAAGSALLVLLILASVYAFNQKKKAKKLTRRNTTFGKSGIRLDWIRRLKIALGAARGLDYLHELANPPIIHRDIKSTNILLDERLNAKVSDFGLSKPLGDGAKGYITTQVKGTMGYLDPEYYMTQQLTEKSDVYSFGVLMLELITARRPIERGRYIVKIVKNAIDKTKELCGLNEILDPTIGLGITLHGFENFVELAMQCVEESSSDRPSMNNVVKEIENMLQLAGSNPNAGESGSTSSSYNVSKGSSSLHPYDNELFDSSVILPRA